MRLTLYSIDTHFHQQTTFENIVGKEKIARNEQFILFLQRSLLNQITVSQFVHIFDIISLFAAELEEPKIGIWGKALSENNPISYWQKPILVQLTLSKTTNFRLFQTEVVCRR